jgi:mono/diheme cytochrome c family protein
VTKSGKVLTGVALILLFAGIGVASFVFRSALPAISPPAPDSFDRALVKQGQGLAHLGNCIGCHTVNGGKSFAGGLPLRTPFGTIYSTNITPARESGIGTWSRDAFARAMREGVARDGTHLYPAFPYDHFTKASDGEIDALYAYLMTRPAVEARASDNRLDWPLNYRFLVAGWNWLFLQEGPSEERNRGRLLAEGLAHCGGCHTPRNKLGAEDNSRAYDGAWADGWYAPPLNAKSPAAQPWTEDELFAYLRTGLSKTHAAAAGPMGGVTRALAQAPESDVRAIAAYFAGMMKDAPGARSPLAAIDRRGDADKAHPDGAALFAGACATCHEAGAPMMQQGRPPLAWGTPLRLDTPHDTLRLIVEGLASPAGLTGPAMPGYGNDFTDPQIAAIAAYLRARFTDLPPWQNLEQAVSAVRKGEGP